MAKSEQELMSGIMSDIKRAAALGLIPEEGAKVSRRGEFIVNPSNIDDAEDRRMRGYRPIPFPKAVRRWGVDAVTGQPGVEETVVADQAALNVALQAGWTTEAVNGPPTPQVPAVDTSDDATTDEAPAPRRRRVTA